MLNFFTRFQNRPRPAPRPQRLGDGGAIVISPDARVSSDANGAVFLHTRSGILFTSNRIGAQIWQGLLERASVEAIAARIGQENGVRHDQARQDAAEFVAELEASGFLSRGVEC